jgi:hypothetical protein
MAYTKVTTRNDNTSVFWNETITTIDGSFPGSSGSNGQVYSMQGVKSGSARVGWRKVVKDGGDATTFYQRDDYKVEAKEPGFAILVKEVHPETPPLWTRTTQGWNGECYPLNAVPFSHLATDVSEVDGEALTLLYKKIRSESSHMNGLQFLGELREALHMIKHPADSLVKGIRKYDALLSKRKKGIRPGLPVEKARDIWKDIVAGTWLEVSFGWKPLLMDTKDIAETIARFTLPDSRRTRVRSYKEGLLGSDISSFPTAISGMDVGSVVDFRTETRGGVQYIVGLRTDGSGPVNQLDRLRNLSGLTLENFVPTIWELMPYSFLIDYFVNVGDVITAAFTQTTGVTWKMKTQRTWTTRTIVQDPMFSVPSPPWTVVKFSGKKSTTVVVKSSVTRTPIVGPLGIPDFTFSLPGSLNRYANMTALLAGFGRNHQPTFRR